MKIGNKELSFTPVRGNAAMLPRVRLDLVVYGMPVKLVNDTVLTPNQARQLARELDVAADAAEGL